jgi:hypothetical protein
MYDTWIRKAYATSLLQHFVERCYRGMSICGPEKGIDLKIRRLGTPAVLFVSRNGSCWLELLAPAICRWGHGQTRQVRETTKHIDSNHSVRKEKMRRNESISHEDV